MIPMHTINCSNKDQNWLCLTFFFPTQWTKMKTGRTTKQTLCLSLSWFLWLIPWAYKWFYCKSSETRWYQECLFFPPRKASAQLWKATCARTLRKTSGLVKSTWHSPYLQYWLIWTLYQPTFWYLCHYFDLKVTGWLNWPCYRFLAAKKFMARVRMGCDSSSHEMDKWLISNIVKCHVSVTPLLDVAAIPSSGSF